jgi:hypothetical protein
VLDSLNPSDDVRPAELSDTIVKLLVRGVHIRTENPLVLIAEDFFEDFRAPRSGYMEERNHRSDKYPKPAALALRLPSGLIDVEDRLSPERLLRSFMSGRQGFGDFLMKLADRAQADLNTENRLGDFLTTSASHTV